MPTRLDHWGVRVTEMERSIRFYVDVFGAEQMTRPFVIDGEFAASVMEGPAGVAFLLCHLRFENGQMLELFQFVEPAHPSDPVHSSRGNTLHVCLVVDDVEATVAQLTASGGSIVFPLIEWGEHRLCYTKDPDGNVIEVSDAPLEELLVGTLELFPAARLDG